MKTVLIVLLALNLTIGAWLLTYGPVDVLREPGRMNLQILPGQFKLLTDADLVQLRKRLASEESAAGAPAASAESVELPQADCLLIGEFPSEAAARKMRSRIADLGLGDKVSNDSSEAGSWRLRVTGVDASAEARIQHLLKDHPKLALEHCVGASGAH